MNTHHIHIILGTYTNGILTLYQFEYLGNILCTITTGLKIPVDMQYKIRYQEQLQLLEEGESLHSMSDLLLPEFGGSTTAQA